MKYILLTIVFSVILFSCKKENSEAIIPSVSIDYFPTTVGTSLVYDITEINIDKAVGLFDTLEYQLKEYFESSFTDNEANTNYRIERYYKTKQDTVWRVLNIWYVTISGNSVYKTEDNYRYKRLIFPVKEGNIWDGNIQNTKKPEEYKITDVNTNEKIGNKDYSNVLVVLQNNNENLIEKQFATEKYVKNVGLAYKEIIEISELEPQPGISWEKRINVGYIYKQILR